MNLNLAGVDESHAPDNIVDQGDPVNINIVTGIAAGIIWHTRTVCATQHTLHLPT